MSAARKNGNTARFYAFYSGDFLGEEISEWIIAIENF